MSGLTEEKYDALLPERVEARLLGLSARTAGFLILALLAFAWTSLLTWSANDPSLTSARGGGTGNAGGPVGAVLSDILLQMLGFGAVVCLFAPMMWAIELIRNERVLYFRFKAALYPLSILLLAGAFATIPVVPGWPLHYAMGGILGDLASSFARAFAGNFASPSLASAIAGILLFAGGMAALAESVGADAKETALAAWTQLRSGRDVEHWHLSMRTDGRPSAPSGVERSPEREPTFMPPQATSGDAEGLGRAPASLWQRLKPAPSPQPQPVLADDESLPPEGPIADIGEAGFAEQFAAHFDSLNLLRPGSRDGADEVFEELDEEELRSRDIARRFAPENGQARAQVDTP
ncbi:MAG: DNA translocase FtsK 4TM domain-containing protein, partial [Hyphomonas sp.]|nr:DNA translocase FtsK 4TM domain-containing protein [Hyphomonas sp.]